MIAGCSQVRKDVPPYIRAAREPISYAGLNLIGLRRRSFTKEQITELQEIYRKIFNSGMNISTALKYLQENMPDSVFVKEVVDFANNTKKGILRSGSEMKEE